MYTIVLISSLLIDWDFAFLSVLKRIGTGAGFSGNDAMPSSIAPFNKIILAFMYLSANSEECISSIASKINEHFIESVFGEINKV
jgi:hypothetical protein